MAQQTKATDEAQTETEHTVRFTGVTATWAYQTSLAAFSGSEVAEEAFTRYKTQVAVRSTQECDEVIRILEQVEDDREQDMQASQRRALRRVRGKVREARAHLRQREEQARRADHRAAHYERSQQQADTEDSEDADQRTLLADGGVQVDPELAANTVEQAADSLEVLLNRDEMRSAAREWDTRKSGTKQEMAESMLEEAREQALALLVEEGVELGGELVDDPEEPEAEAEQEAEQEAEDLYEDADEQETENADQQPQEAEQNSEGQASDEAEDSEQGSEAAADAPEMVAPEDVPAEVMDEIAREYGMGAGAVKGSLAFQDTENPDPETEADEAALEARKRAAQPDEDDTEGEDDGEELATDENGAALAGALLHRDRDAETDHGKMRITEKQQRVIEAAVADPTRTQAEVAEAADASQRYTNRTLNRYDTSEHDLHEQAADEDADEQADE